MSIGPGVIAVPPVNAPGLQESSGVPVAQAGGGAAAWPHADFASALNAGAADPAQQVTARPMAAYRPGAIAPRNTLGDQVLGGLEKLGRSVEAMEGWGSPRPAPKTAAAPAASAGAAPQHGAQKQNQSDPVSDMRNLWETSMRDQRQTYSTMFNFELIAESSQSLLKSLKSLLTQGGG